MLNFQSIKIIESILPDQPIADINDPRDLKLIPRLWDYMAQIVFTVPSFDTKPYGKVFRANSFYPGDKINGLKLLKLKGLDSISGDLQFLNLLHHVNPVNGFLRLLLGNTTDDVFNLFLGCIEYIPKYKHEFIFIPKRLGDNPIARIDLTVTKVKHIYYMPLTFSDRISLKIKTERLAVKQKTASKVKSVDNAFSHVLSRNEALNVFQFSPLRIELKFTAARDRGNTSAIAYIHARSISTMCDRHKFKWVEIGRIERLANKSICTIVYDSKLESVDYLSGTIPALKSLGLYDRQCIRAIADTIALLPTFWQQFDCMLDTSNLKINSAIKIKFKR